MKKGEHRIERSDCNTRGVICVISMAPMGDVSRAHTGEGFISLFTFAGSDAAHVRGKYQRKYCKWQSTDSNVFFETIEVSTYRSICGGNIYTKYSLYTNQYFELKATTKQLR